MNTEIVDAQQDHSTLIFIQRLDVECFSDSWSEAQFRYYLDKPERYRVFLILSKGDRVGYLVFATLLDEAELLRIGVVPEQRGKGVASVALCRAERRLFELGYARLLLEVRESNAPARHLYQSAGYQLDGLRKGYYPASADYPAEDAILMSKVLNNAEIDH